MSEANISKLSDALGIPPTLAQSTGTPESLVRRPDRKSDGRPSGEVVDEIPPVDDRLRALTRWYRDYEKDRRAIVDPLTQHRIEFENAIADCQLVYPQADFETINQRLKTADGITFGDAEKQKLDLCAALREQGMEQNDAIVDAFGSPLSASFAGFSDETFDTEREDGNTVTENYAERVIRWRSIEPNAIRRWSRTVVGNKSSGDLEDMSVSAPASDQEMRAPSSGGCADYGDEPVTERKLRLKGAYEAKTDWLRWKSARERTALLEALATGSVSGGDDNEDIATQKWESSIALSTILGAINATTYSAEQRAWVLAPRPLPA